MMRQEDSISATCPSAAALMAYRENGIIKAGNIEMSPNAFIELVMNGNPKILGEVEDIMAGGTTPYSVRAGSHKKAVCMDDVEGPDGILHRVVWTQYIYNIDRYGCPYRKGASKDVWMGFNDLASVRPDVAAQWDYEMNHLLTPDGISYGSCYKAWWVMNYFDELTGNTFRYRWRASVNNRTSNDEECPHLKHSWMERASYSVLNRLGIAFDAEARIDGCSHRGSLRFDIYMPELGMAIELDGIQHFRPVGFFGGEEAHRNAAERDAIKDKFCTENRIRLLRIPYSCVQGRNEKRMAELIRRFVLEGTVSRDIMEFYRQQERHSYMECLESTACAVTDA